VYLDDSVDNAYYKAIASLSLNFENNKKHSDLGIAYSPLHGTGITMIEKALNCFGFNNLYTVENQKNPDGNFPTVKFPNPEESDAMNEVVTLAKKKNAAIAFATDPDGDRIGVAARDESGDYVLFNGNQIAALLAYYVLLLSKKSGRLKPDRDIIIKTIVTTDLIQEIAADFKVTCHEVLTGFKWIGLKIKDLQDNGNKKFLYGGEESYGYLLGSFSRDKDAIIISSLIAEVAAYTAENKISLVTFMDTIYEKYGYYFEQLRSLTFEGFEGVQKIQNIMNSLRKNTPSSIANIDVLESIDFLNESGDLPASNVFLLKLGDGTKIFARPSGTEPKIKFYFMTHTRVNSALLSEIKRQTHNKMDSIIESFLNLINTL